MKDHFELFVDKVEAETKPQYEDTDSPSKSPTKEKTDDEDLNVRGEGEGVKEFDLHDGDSPDFKSLKARDEFVESPSPGVPDAKALETPRKNSEGSDGEKQLGLDSNVGLSKSSLSKGRDVEGSPEDKKKKKVSFPEKGDKTSKGTKPTPEGDDDSETPDPIDESGLLTLSILDSADSKEVNLNCHREKETKPPFTGDYDDISTSTQHRMDSKIIDKNMNVSQSNTVITQNAQGYPGKSESFAQSQSVATMGANMKNSGFSHSRFNKTGQTITDDIKMPYNFASPTTTKVRGEEGPFGERMSSGSDMEDKQARVVFGY